MKKLKTFLCVIFAALMFAMCCACGNSSSGSGTENPPDGGTENPPVVTPDMQPQVNEALAGLSEYDFTVAQLSGVDNLGRAVSPLVGLNNKHVGIFYFVATGWDGTQHNIIPVAGHDYIYDISKLLEKYPADRYPIDRSPITALKSGATNAYYKEDEAPEGKSYYWGEPLYGYYRSDDEWVIRRHLELFANAGIDFLYLDYTNNLVYPQATKALLKVIMEMQKEGYNPPKVTFFMQAVEAGQCAYSLGAYVEPAYFADKTYDSCWFRGDKEMNPDQKPILVGNFTGFDENSVQRQKYLLIEEQWPNRPFNSNAIPWMDHSFPQKIHTPWGENRGVVNVSVSQGGFASSEAYYRSEVTYKARGFDWEEPLKHGNDEENVMKGTNFDYQWMTVFNNIDKVDMVTVTGWNEWIVTKLLNDDPASQHLGRGCFVDSFNMAYSRDAEMMKGGYADNYYMQIVQNIRKFKGITVEGSDNVAKFDRKSITDLSDLSVWESVKAKYLDIGLGTVERNHTLVDRSLKAEDKTNRNDIEYVKICNDGSNLYVAVTCRNDVVMPAEGDAKAYNWMNLYLSCGGEGWQGYDFIINGVAQSGKMNVEKPNANGVCTAVGSADYIVSGNTVVYSVPLSVLGVKEGAAIGVKATDNLQAKCDADEFYTHGDSAPMGRLNYTYKIN